MKRYVIEELVDQDTQKVLSKVAKTKKKAVEAQSASGRTATGQKPDKIVLEPVKTDMLGIR